MGQIMFDTVIVLLDDQARPVLLIPEDLPAGDTYVDIVSQGIDIRVGEAIQGSIRDIDDTSLAMLGLQDKIGMATYKGTKETDTLPDTIQYVASVRDTRF